MVGTGYAYTGIGISDLLVLGMVRMGEDGMSMGLIFLSKISDTRVKNY
jgi:hypothetical protein